jgi:hypothetical protein
MALKVIRTWVRKRGTNKVFQLTPKMAEREPPRIDADLILIPEAEARKLQNKAAQDKKQAALDRHANRVSDAVKRARQRQAEIELAAQEREQYEKAIAAQEAASGQPAVEAPEPEPQKVPPVPSGTMVVTEDDLETPEQAAARLDALEMAAAGGETGAVPDGYRDDLEGKKRAELFDIIDELNGRGGAIQKKGTNKALVAAIRETRTLVEAAEADAERQAAAAAAAE